MRKLSPSYLLRVYETDHMAYSLPLDYAEDLYPYFSIPQVIRLKISTLLSTSVIIDYSHKAIIKCENLNNLLNDYLTTSYLYSDYMFFNVPYNCVDDFYYNFSIYLANVHKTIASDCDPVALVAFCKNSRSLP